MTRLTNMLNKFTAARTRVAALTLGAAVSLMASPMVQAAVPTMVASGGNAGSGDYMGHFRDYAGSGIGLALLLLNAFCFLAVIGSSIGKYAEFNKGKATLGDVKVTVGVGVLILMIVVYLSVQAAGVIGTSGAFAGVGAPA